MASLNFKEQYNDGACIAAIATAAGSSALAIVRISGNGCLEALGGVFSRPQALLKAEGNSVVYGWIVDEGKKIDEVLISKYTSPKSYTGEDAADICCHGGSSAPLAVLKTLLKHGFRGALNGEFSLRSFLNGKIDLTKAESILEIISAKTDHLRSNAIFRLSGALETTINNIKQKILNLLSEIELLLDYSEVDGVGNDQNIMLDDTQINVLQEVKTSLLSLKESYNGEKLYREGVLVVIAGPPNAGKSSLFNLLVKEDRSIVTELAGTTRDWIDASIVIDDIPIRLVDTAGLHDSCDTVEKLGIKRSLDLVAEADAVLYVLDGECGVTKEDLDFFSENKNIASKIIILWNKCDISKHDISKQTENLPLGDMLCINTCAKNGEGIKEVGIRLTTLLRNLFLVSEFVLSESLQTTLGSERQCAIVSDALISINDAIKANNASLPLDIISLSIREAIDHLGRLTGEVSTDDILESMFSKFCVGK
ncbi:MAG: tRNA uridine-5-carboxymethylaminomethyl(34) synthesis GTPase MnmE [Termitinemataceae bacterium]|nr:MAG: tRNA uridine-5-carboxymethylaminomethyl(34) synthesis GTPase MnmE [Termitinemataceae bacterium]